MTKATAKARKTKPGPQSGFNSRYPLVFGFEVILRDIFLYRQGNRLSIAIASARDHPNSCWNSKSA